MLEALLEDVEEVPGERLPSLLEVNSLPMAELVAALGRSSSAANVPLAHAVCTRLALLVQRPGMDQAVAAAGGIEAVVTAMRTFPSSSELQAIGCELVALCCLKTDAHDLEAEQRRLLALNAGALQAIVAGLAAHAVTNDPTGDLLTRGCMALAVIVGDDPSLRVQAVALGADAGWLPGAS